MRAVLTLWRRHPLLTSAFVLSSAAVLFFAVRLVVFTVYWANPAHRDQALAGWMTPRYVAQSWHIAPQDMAEILQLSRDGQGRRITLAQIAEARGMPLPVLLDELDAAIAAHRAAQ
ncbi:hypothetical protein [Aestuariicoccus sp. MJ-SS9]|uniref:hypothetical protein n=1 Tax=Aestuariicoccus sp. MJ-SS9 TaxID=3079855 RepID=UPI0029107965|nr:hypothetical protein [Aestuariicoccus sp. MJ-SS9]MDU8913026.1 hypothetical protein [Aestuariicoccus sp. MJ-SS9]